VTLVVRRSYATLMLLQRFSSQIMRIYLVRTFDYFVCGWCFFRYCLVLSSGDSLAFNCCIRYLYCLKRFDHISPFARGILGCTLEEYYQYRLVCSVSIIDRPTNLGRHVGAMLHCHLLTGSPCSSSVTFLLFSDEILNCITSRGLLK
jgi:hypothetical protein